MSQNSYLNLLNLALSQYDVEALVRIWKLSLTSKEFGLILRTAIKKLVPELAQHYNIQYDEYTTFQEFVEEYDLKVYEQLCNDHVYYCIVFFARRGDLRNVKIALEKGKDYLGLVDYGLEAAARGGHRDLVDFFIARGAIDFGKAVEGAAEGNHKDLVKFFADFVYGKKENLYQDRDVRRTIILNWALKGAARGGHWDLVYYLIEEGAEKGNEDWNNGLMGAAEGGHQDLVEFFLENGATPGPLLLKMVFTAAAGSGNLDLVKFFIARGADNWNGALREAAYAGYKDVAALLIQKGANNLDEAVSAAASGRHKELVKFLIEKGATNLNGALSAAIENNDKEIMELVVDAGADLGYGLEEAYLEQRKDLMDFFLERGAVPNERVAEWLARDEESKEWMRKNRNK